MNRLTALAAAACLFHSAALFAQESRGLVYDFSATWCGPCQRVAPIVEKLEREGLPIQKVDIDKQRDLANKFGIQSIPTFVLVIDGKEADRTSGMQTEADLRRLIARIPRTAPETAATPRNAPAQQGLSMPVELGQPGDFQRSAPAQNPPARNPPTRVAEAEQRRGLRDLIPFGRKNNDAAQAAAAPQVVRGNDSTISQPNAGGETASNDADPMHASVRIRVITNGRIDLGSGTVISSKPGFTQILTCAHIFKEFTDDSRIEVDVFERGGVSPYVARLVKFDATSDLGLISIPTDQPVAQTKVGGPDAAPAVGTPVAAIGCSGGEEPTRQQSRVTDVDKYEGPHNLLCTGVPVRGRSGGGLFNQQGEIVGVCSAADEQEQRGFYSGLLAIHKLLNDCNLTALYAPPAAKREVPEERLAATDPAFEKSASREMPSALAAEVPAAQQQPTAGTAAAHAESAAMDVQAGDAEVVVIIRDRSQPEAANRVVILHQASPKFMSYLSGELSESDLQMDMMGNATSSLEVPVERARRTASAVAGQQDSLVVGKPMLRPTTLSQPVEAQRYVRSRSR